MAALSTFYGLTYAALAAPSSLRVTLPGRSSSSAIIRLNKTRHGHGIQARSAGAIADPVVTSHARDVFREEQDKIKRYCEKIVPDADIWNLDPELSRYLCSMATKSVRLASIVMELAVIRPDKPDVEPIDRIKKYLEGTVRTFVNITEDVYHKKVTKRTIVCFVSAVDVVALMSYIAAQATLRDLRTNCSPNSDVERAWGEHRSEMNKLKHVFDMADSCDAKKMLKPTLTDAIALVRSFVTLTIASRKNALLGATAKVQDDVSLTNEKSPEKFD